MDSITLGRETMYKKLLNAEYNEASLLDQVIPATIPDTSGDDPHKCLTVPDEFVDLFYISDDTELAQQGSITSKFNLFNVFLKHKTELMAIAEVHRLGLTKYQPYSWLVNPETTDGTPELCLRAAMRHIAAHDMGCTMDTDGLPHLHHYICRLGMAAVASIRELEYQKFQRNFTTVETNEYFNTMYETHPSSELWHNFILPEHLIALSIGKFNAENVPFIPSNQFSMCLFTHDKYTTTKYMLAHANNQDQNKLTKFFHSQLVIEAMCYICTCFLYGCDYVNKCSTTNTSV